MTNHENLSVILPAYNGAKYIRVQIESILCDIGLKDELIISDDCSNDETLEVIKEFSDSRIKLFKQNRNIGLNKNIEFLITMTSFDMILLSDQDDVWIKGRSDAFRSALKDNILVIDDCIIVQEDLSIIHKSYRSLFPFSESLFKNIYKCSFLGCCMGFQKALAYKSVPFPSQLIGHDLCLGLTALIYNYRVLLLNEGKLLYRRHSNTTSTAVSLVQNRSKNISYFFERLMRRKLAVFYVLRQIYRKFL